MPKPPRDEPKASDDSIPVLVDESAPGGASQRADESAPGAPGASVALESGALQDDDSAPTLTEPFARAPSAAPMPAALARFIASVPPPPVTPAAPALPAPPPRRHVDDEVTLTDFKVESRAPRIAEPLRVETRPPPEARVETEAPLRVETRPPLASEAPPRVDSVPPPSVFPVRRADVTLRTRHLIVVGGGRGGVGKSLVAEGLAVYFAQLGKNVVLVDADANGSNLHAHLGTSALAVDAFTDDAIPFEDVLSATEVPGLRLLAYPHEALRPPGTLRGTRKARWLSRLRKLDADFLVVDAGPGNSQFTLDLLLAADVPVLVTTPEPPSVEAVYRLLRAGFVQKVRRAVHRDRLRAGILERALAEFGRLPPPLPFVRALSKQDPGLAELAWNICQKMAFQLVVNQTRLRSDIELGGFMSELCWRQYGVQLQELGHVEQDDSVHFAVRRKRSLLVDNPAAKASRNVERLARRVLGKLLTPEGDLPLAPLPSENPDYYAVLGLSRGASDEDARRNFKRRREMLHEDSIATFSLFDKSEQSLERSRLEEAYDTLMDPIRRQAYDLSLFGHSESAPVPSAAPRLRDREMVERELSRELGPEAEYSGALLRKVREAYGASLDDVAQHSKIAKGHLAAIEDERWVDLPAAVYVRGYVTEVAKFFGLDVVHVQRTYMRRYQAARA